MAIPSGHPWLHVLHDPGRHKLEQYSGGLGGVIISHEGRGGQGWQLSWRARESCDPRAWLVGWL